MPSQSNAGLYRIISLCTLLFWSTALSQYTYIEGTDTTNADGEGMDGLFTILSYSNSYSIDGATLVYGTSGDPAYLNCTFDELQKVPDSIRYVLNGNSLYNVVGHCFLVCEPLDSTWAKVHITQQLSDKRFVYRYGQNRTSRNKLLVFPDYDRQRIYRPNNTYWSEIYEDAGRIQDITLTWEPPLPCSRPVTGYIVYESIDIIDTAQPIDLKEWEVIGATSSDEYEIHFKAGPEYINVLAVYQNDTTDFSGVFTRMDYPLSTIPHQQKLNRNGAYLSIKNPFVPLFAPVSLYTLDGRRVAKGTLYGGKWVNLVTGAFIQSLYVSDDGKKKHRLIGPFHK